VLHLSINIKNFPWKSSNSCLSDNSRLVNLQHISEIMESNHCTTFKSSFMPYILLVCDQYITVIVETFYSLLDLCQGARIVQYSDWTMGWTICGSNSSMGKKFISSPNHPEQLASTPCVYLSGMYKGNFSFAVYVLSLLHLWTPVDPCSFFFRFIDGIIWESDHTMSFHLFSHS
jgi:hypothetical protein